MTASSCDLHGVRGLEALACECVCFWNLCVCVSVLCNKVCASCENYCLSSTVVCRGGKRCKSNKLVIVSPISASSQRRAHSRSHPHTHKPTQTERHTHALAHIHAPCQGFSWASHQRHEAIATKAAHIILVCLFVFPLAERRCSFPWPNPAQTGLLTWCCLRGTRIGKAGCNKHGLQMLFSFGSRCWMEEVLDFEAKRNKIWSDFFFFYYYFTLLILNPQFCWFDFILASKLSFISLSPSPHPTPAKAHLTWPADLWPLLLSAPLQTWEQLLVLPLISARPSLNSRLLPAHLLVAQTRVHQDILKNKRRDSASLKKQQWLVGWYL